LYGKEKPLRKLPAPFLVALDPLIWKILQKKHHLIEMINYKRGRCHCEVTWPRVSCKGLEVTFKSMATELKEEQRSMSSKPGMRTFLKTSAISFLNIKSPN